MVNLFFELIFGRTKTGTQTDVAFVLTCCGFLTQTCANLWGSVGIMGNNMNFTVKKIWKYLIFKFNPIFNHYVLKSKYRINHAIKGFQNFFTVLY